MKNPSVIVRLLRWGHCALAPAAAVWLLAAGCALNPWYSASRNIDNSKQLRVGMTKQEVLDIMGPPLADESFCRPDCWYYYIEPVWIDGLTTEEECMPLVFEDGILVGWGRGFHVRYRLDRKNAAVDSTAVDPTLEATLKPNAGGPTVPEAARPASETGSTPAPAEKNTPASETGSTPAPAEKGAAKAAE